MTWTFWKKILGEARETVGGLVKFTVRRLTWKESMRFLRKSIASALLERAVGTFIFAVVLFVVVAVVRLVAMVLNLGGLK